MKSRMLVAWMFTGLVLLNLAAGVVWLIKSPGWSESMEGNRRVWRRGDVLHSDRNGDGRVDEINEPAASGERRVQRDTDLDGFLDVKYLVTSNGVASRIETIHERAPRH